MTLKNAFEDLATNSSVVNVKTSVDAVKTSVDLVETAVNETTSSISLLSEQTILLRKLLKIMESQATIDSAQRQRITLDALTANLTLSTVTTVGTVSSITTLPTLSTVTTLNQFAGVDLRWQWMENARIAYNTGIRSKLTY